jgi:hypothetical protein
METSRFHCAIALALGLGLAGASGTLAGTLTVRPGVSNGGQARYIGNQGLEVNVASPDRGAAYLQSSHPSGEVTYRARFFMNLRGLAMSEGDEFDLLAAYDGSDPVPPATTGNAELRIVVRQSAGQKVLSAFVRTDAGSELEIPATVPLVDGWRMVEINWARATAAGANNGLLELWVDGVKRAGRTGVDNDTTVINYVRWGTVTGVDLGTSGTFKLDEYASQRSGYIGPIQVFSDVPASDSLFKFIQGLYASEITAGCGSGQYCPTSNVTREQMAIFLIRGIHGPDYAPPPATGIFSDVPTGTFQAPYVERFYNEGITSGCGTSPLRYCPTDPVTRAQMAVFLLRAKHGSSYTPPPATGTLFSDVPANAFAAAWIEQLYNEGISAGCATSPLRFCPTDPVTRAQMAVFILRAFSLPPQEIGP